MGLNIWYIWCTHGSLKLYGQCNMLALPSRNSVNNEDMATVVDRDCPAQKAASIIEVLVLSLTANEIHYGLVNICT